MKITIKLILLGLASLLLLSGCSALRIGYYYADWIIVAKIDDMIDLNREQKQKVNEIIDDLHHWHQAEEIPRVIALLDQAQGKVATELKSEDFDWLFTEFNSMKLRIVDRMAEDVSALLTTLTDDQIDHLEASLAEHNQEDEEKYAMPVGEWEENQKERVINNLNSWFGDLSPQQEKELLAAYQVDRTVQQRYHGQSIVFQQKFITLLRQKPSAELIKSTLTQWILHPERFYSSDYVKFQERQKLKRKSFYLTLDRSITKEQRHHLIQKLEYYQYDFEAIYLSSL